MHRSDNLWIVVIFSSLSAILVLGEACLLPRQPDVLWTVGSRLAPAPGPGDGRLALAPRSFTTTGRHPLPPYLAPTPGTPWETAARRTARRVATGTRNRWTERPSTSDTRGALEFIYGSALAGSLTDHRVHLDDATALVTLSHHSASHPSVREPVAPTVLQLGHSILDEISTQDCPGAPRRSGGTSLAGFFDRAEALQGCLRGPAHPRTIDAALRAALWGTQASPQAEAAALLRRARQGSNEDLRTDLGFLAAYHEAHGPAELGATYRSAARWGSLPASIAEGSWLGGAP